MPNPCPPRPKTPPARPTPAPKAKGISPSRQRRCARDAVAAHLRRLQEGYSLSEIAKAGASQPRARAANPYRGAGQPRDEDKPDHARMQIARLAPVLRRPCAPRSRGDEGAVRELFAVLDRLDRYCGTSDSYRKISIAELGEGDARLNAATDRDRALSAAPRRSMIDGGGDGARARRRRQDGRLSEADRDDEDEDDLDKVDVDDFDDDDEERGLEEDA